MMKTVSKKHFFVFAFLSLTSITGYSQKEFFRSNQVFNKEQLDNFHSSISIQGDLLIFNANDHHLYAYNKKDGSLKWSVKTNYKSDIPVFVDDNILYAGVYENEQKRSAQFEVSSGKLLRIFPFGPLVTKPVIKNGILYGTAIYNYGCIIAYDINKDTVLWSRFIGHGYSRQPYYEKNKIIANADSHNWVELGYDGSLLDTTCAKKPDFYVEGISCVRVFSALTHDGLEIRSKLAEDIFADAFTEPVILTTPNFTYALNDDKLTILSGRLRKKQQLMLSDLPGELPGNGIEPRLLKADDENIWLLYSDRLLQYNHKIKMLVRSTDLSKWKPQQLLIDGENIWLTSGNDGLLYGLSL